MSELNFYLLQINDALFPIGAYSHSQGLETSISFSHDRSTQIPFWMKSGNFLPPIRKLTAAQLYFPAVILQFVFSVYARKGCSKWRKK